MKILISGINSKISKSLISQLTKNNHKIVGITRNKNKYTNTHNIDIIEHDFSNSYKKRIEADVVIHIAGFVSYDNNIGFDEYYKNNILVTKNLLESMVHSSIKRIIYFSTIDIYDIKRYGVHKEDDKENPSSFYAISKLACEQLINSFKNFYNIDPMILRLGKVYGDSLPKEDSLLLLSQKIKSHDSLDFYHLNSLKPLIHLNDINSLIEGCLSQGSGTYNLVGEHIKFIDIIKHIAANYNKSVQVNEIDSDLIESCSTYSNQKLLELTQWTPTHFFADNVKAFVAQ